MRPHDILHAMPMREFKRTLTKLYFCSESSYNSQGPTDKLLTAPMFRSSTADWQRADTLNGILSLCQKSSN